MPCLGTDCYSVERGSSPFTLNGALVAFLMQLCPIIIQVGIAIVQVGIVIIQVGIAILQVGIAIVQVGIIAIILKLASSSSRLA